MGLSCAVGRADEELDGTGLSERKKWLRVLACRTAWVAGPAVDGAEVPEALVLVFVFVSWAGAFCLDLRVTVALGRGWPRVPSAGLGATAR